MTTVTASVTGVSATGYCGAYDEMLLEDGGFILLEDGGNFVLQNEFSYTARFNVTGVFATGQIGQVVESYGGSVLVTGIFATGVIGNVVVWSDVVDTQNPDWIIVPDTQNPNWVNIQDAQSSNWANVA